MNRLCERPGCSAPAEVAYGFDADRQSMWLDALVAVQGMRHGVLCRRHADAMIVPLGWMLDDRRDPPARLFKSPAAPATRPQPRRERRPRDLTGEQMTLDPPSGAGTLTASPHELDPARSAAIVTPEQDPLPTTSTEPAACATDARPDATWVPVFDPADDLHGLLNARGRLLSRAFNGAPTDEH